MHKALPPILRVLLLLLLAPPPSPPPLAAANPVLSSIYQVQSEPREGAFKSIGPGSSAKGKEKADTDHGHNEDGHK